jgi:hypothetical protein
MYPTLTIKNAEVAHYSAKSMPAEVPPRNPALAKPARILAPYLSARSRRIESSPQRDFKQPINRATFNNVISRIGYEGRFSPHGVRGTARNLPELIRKVGDSTAQGSRQTSYVRLLRRTFVAFPAVP